MLIWLVVLGIFALLGVTGYYNGAIRSLVSLVGLLVALFVTLPLAEYLKPLVPKVGLVHPIWPFIVPPVVVFLLLVAIFAGLGFWVHHKIAIRFKYGADDYTRIRWERLNRRLGVSVAFVAAAIYSLLVGVVVYVVGYPVVQVTGDGSPFAQRMLGQLRQDIQTSGLDKSLASFDPMGENYYRSTDIFGLLYHNGAMLQDRLYNYPAFLTLGERAELKDIATDTDLQQQLQTAGPAVGILNNPKILAVVNNPEILEKLRQVDLKDLYTYLRSGRSEKYAEEKILGRWKLDVAASLVAAKRKNPEMPVAEMLRIKRLLTIFLPRLTFMATPDSEAVLRMEVTDEAKRIIDAVQAAATAAANAAPGGDSGPPASVPANVAARYGLTRRPAAAPAPAAGAPAAKNVPAIPDFNLASNGTWSRDGLRYKLKLKTEKGADFLADATIDGDRMQVVRAGGQTLIFIR